MKIFNEEIMSPLFSILEKCKGVEQMEIHHPEGDVFKHSLQVLWWAFKESIDTDLILAAMLHDVGKAIISKGHEKECIPILEPFLSAKSLWLIENHMRIWTFVKGEMKKLSKVQKLASHPWLPELVYLARWDQLGRNARKKVTYDRQDIIDRLNKCVDIHFENNNKDNI